MLALLFTKATNDVADVVTVPHFKEIAQQMFDEDDILFNMKVEDLKNPERVAPLIHRCSK